MSFDFPDTLCLAEVLRRSCEKYRSNVALIEVDREQEKARLTYGDVLREGDRLASLMAELGFKPGDRCILLMPNQSKWVVSAAAVIWSGGVLVPIDVKLSPGEQAGLIDYAEPTVVIADAALWEPVEAKLSPSLRKVPVLLVDSPKPVEDPPRVSWASQPAALKSFPHIRSRRDVAAIVFTSGTGGMPKGCMLSDEAYLSQLESLYRIFPDGPGERYLSVIPANHVVDFMCGFLIPMVSGTAVVHQRTLRSQYIVGTLKKYEITHTAVVPLLLKLLEDGIVEKMDRLPSLRRKVLRILTGVNSAVTKHRSMFWLSRLLLKPIHDRFGGRLKRIFVGGAFVDEEVADFFYSLGFSIHVGYGLTEVCQAVSLNDCRPYRSDTVGKPLHGCEVEIRNADAAGVGEVWVRSPCLMSGYFKNERLTAETIVDGWLKSGDLGRLDAKGHLKLTGRSKNMIVTKGGKNVYPEDVELAFGHLRESEESCIFSAHYVWPEVDAKDDRLVLVVRPKNHAQSDAGFEEHIKQVNRSLDQYKRIGGYLVWEEPFPRTASLKVKRDSLALAIRGGASPSSSVVAL
ncbi:MAG TPA: AMP-binding protein [bacterium]|nr:AMP-binding protein [bacterium]